MTELETLQDELQWAIAANADHPRTQNALEWAAEELEKLTAVKTVEEVRA
jgi:hypothetical protein